MSPRSLLVVVIVLLARSPALPQVSDPHTFDRYLITTEQIPSPNFGRVNVIVRDDRGFLWFGTTRGLCKYDGYQVRAFAIGEGDPPEGNVVGHDRQLVTAILRVDGGSFLIGTDLGLWTFDRSTETSSLLFPDEGFSNDRINALAEGPDGTIWIGTGRNGLIRYDRTSHTVRRYMKENGLSDNSITALFFDHASTLWVGTHNGGIDFLDPTSPAKFQRSTPVAASLAFAPHRITAICESNAKELWVGTDNGLRVLDRETGLVHPRDLPSQIHQTISSVASDPTGRVWSGVADFGLVSWAGTTFTQFPTSPQVSRLLSGIKYVYLDPVASTGGRFLLWVGTRNVVEKIWLVPNPFTSYIRGRDSLELEPGAVLSLCEDHAGILWVGLWGGGLERFERINGRYRRIAHFAHAPAGRRALPSNDVNALTEDHAGDLWIGTSGGLAMLNPERDRIRTYTHANDDTASLAHNKVNAVCVDHAGTIWVATDGGISRLVRGDPDRFVNYLYRPTEAHPFGSNTVSDLFEDRGGTLWAATYGKGLERFSSDGRFTPFRYPGDSAGHRENFIYKLAEDREGTFWLSARGALVSFAPATGAFRSYSVEQLYDPTIFGIYPDANGDLWFSSTTGLTRFNPRNQTVERYEENDGVPFKEFFSGFIRDKRGNLLLGGIDGFMEFAPENVSTISHPPEIAITSLSVFGKEVPASVLSEGSIRLRYDENYCSFSFAALDYSNPSRNRFAYRMVGVDKDWIDAGTRNYASYPILDPGDYVFQVKGCNSDNVWNVSGTSITLLIAPPFWRTWWFRALIAGVIVSVIYTVYRYRLERLLELDRLRLRIADDLHDDVGSNLSSIAMVSRAIQRAPELSPATKSRLSEIYETAVSTSEGMKDIVWFITPRNDTLDDLVLRMKDTASSLLAEIEHEFAVPTNVLSRRVSIDFKRNFFLGFKEILTNIVKHSLATNVKIVVQQRDDMLEMVIGDNGRGFDPHVMGLAGSGNGLASLRNRAKSIGGACEITSQRGSGTEVRFSGKL